MIAEIDAGREGEFAKSIVKCWHAETWCEAIVEVHEGVVVLHVLVAGVLLMILIGLFVVIVDWVAGLGVIGSLGWRLILLAIVRSIRSWREMTVDVI